MMKKRLFFGCMLGILIVCGFIGYSWLVVREEGHMLYIAYGEEIPNFALIGNGERLDINDVLTDDKLNLLCYVSDQCSVCLEELSLIKVMQSYQEIEDNINIIVLWQDNIPEDRVSDLKNNYSLNNAVRLSDATPNFLMFDKGKLNFQTVETSKLINKILDNLDKDKLRKEIIKQFKKESNGKVNKLLFVTEDCLECSKKLQGEIEDIMIISNYDQEGAVIDKYGFYSNTFEIYLYPEEYDFDKNG